MKFHDITCHEDGWSHLVDGVRNAVFPSWFLALNAARKHAELDMRKGLAATIRYQSADGTMLPVHQKAIPGSGLRQTAAVNVQQERPAARLAG